MSDLLPCPFCGGGAEISQIGNDFTRSRGFEVKCLTWGCATKKRAMVIRHTLDQAREWAVAAWNKRAPVADDTTPCIACLIPLKEGDRFYPDVSGGVIHAGCCGPERESYVGADGEPLKPGEAIPEASIWVAGPVAVAA